MIRKTNPVTHRPDGTTVIHLKTKIFEHELDCVIDTADYDVVKGYWWNVKRDCRTWYVFSTSKTIYLHHVLAGKGTDHADGNGLNNRRENLRPADKFQQSYNRRKKAGQYSSKYKGVHWCKTRQKWVAKVNGRQLGYFDTEAAAAVAYNAVASQEQGNFAVLNPIGG